MSNVYDIYYIDISSGRTSETGHTSFDIPLIIDVFDMYLCRSHAYIDNISNK